MFERTCECVYGLMVINIWIVHCAIDERFIRLSSHKALPPNMYSRQLTTLSLIGCSLKCVQDCSCKSASYRKTTRECMLSDVLPNAIDFYGQDDPSVEVFRRDDWMLVFRGIQGIGRNPRRGWVDGSDEPTSDPACQQLTNNTCKHHFRHQFVAAWEHLNIAQVKIAFFNGSLEQSITFDGRNSTISSWFSPSRILSSTWGEVTANASYKDFAIEGIHLRGFHVSMSLRETCRDALLFAAVIFVPEYCSYHLHNDTITQIFFATGENAGKPQTLKEMAIADGFAIYIK